MMNIFRKGGPLRNGAERGHGSIWHSVEGDAYAGGRALCGDAPAISWSNWTPPGQQVTCKKCLKLLAKQQAEAALPSDLTPADVKALFSLPDDDDSIHQQR